MNKLVAQALAKKENGEKGFTLIELLVVVIIIGILAAIAIPVFLNMREGAWRSSVESDVHNTVLAIETASTQNNGKLPDATAGNALAVESTDNTVTYALVGGSTTEYTVTGTSTNLATTEIFTYTSSTGDSSWPTTTP